MSCKEMHENYIYTSSLNTTKQIGLGNVVKTIVCLIIKFHIQLSCQHQMIIFFIIINITG